MDMERDYTAAHALLFVSLIFIFISIVLKMVLTPLFNYEESCCKFRIWSCLVILAVVVAVTFAVYMGTRIEEYRHGQDVSFCLFSQICKKLF